MKLLRFAFFVLLPVWSATVFGQHSSPQRMPQATLQRLIAMRTDRYDGSAFVPVDSTHYKYSGIRGGGGYPGVYAGAFDFGQYMVAQGSGYRDSTRTTQTFDAHDNLLTTLTEQFDGMNWTKSAKGELHYTAQGLMDTDAGYLWSAGAWVNDNKWIYSYDARRNLTMRMLQYHDNNGNWLNSELDHFQYNEKNQTTELDYAIWQSGAWVNQTQSFSTYDQYGRESTFTYLKWQSGAWIPDFRSTYLFSKTRVLSWLTELWDAQRGAFVNWRQHLYSSDANDHVIRNLTQFWINSQWQDSVVQNVTWYQNFRTSVSILLNVNAAARTLDTVQRDISIQDQAGNSLLDSSDLFVSPGVWQHSYVNRRAFDVNNYSTLDEYDNWDAGAGAWRGGSKVTSSYNSFGQYTDHEEYEWKSGAWMPAILTHYYYEEYIDPRSVRALASVSIVSQAYPDPFTRSFTIEFNSLKGGELALFLYDVTGKLITKTVSTISAGENKITCDAGYALPNGCYTYTLVVGGEVSSGKVVTRTN